MLAQNAQGSVYKASTPQREERGEPASRLVVEATCAACSVRSLTHYRKSVELVLEKLTQPKHFLTKKLLMFKSILLKQ